MKPLKKEIRSFKHAFVGIYSAVKSETHVKIHVVAAILVVAAGIKFQVTLMEWCVLLLCIGAIISAELFNTAIEKWLDFVYPQKHKTVGFVKDVSAGAVLILAMVSAVIAAIIFIPKF